MWEYTSIRTLPPPFLERGLLNSSFDELPTYPSRGSSHLVVLFYAASVFYSAVVAVLTALIVTTVAGSVLLSRCSG